MSLRTERLGSTLQREIAAIIQREMRDPRIKILPAITRVTVAPDLTVADVYVSIMGTPGQQSAALNALKHAAGMMRTRLSRELSLRTMPFLRFQIDEGMRKELEMLELLHKIEAERNEREAAKAAAAAEKPADDAGSVPSPGTPGEG